MEDHKPDYAHSATPTHFAFLRFILCYDYPWPLAGAYKCIVDLCSENQDGLQDELNTMLRLIKFIR
jgi:hypothetical protein